MPTPRYVSCLLLGLVLLNLTQGTLSGEGSHHWGSQGSVADASTPLWDPNIAPGTQLASTEYGDPFSPRSTPFFGASSTYPSLQNQYPGDASEPNSNTSFVWPDSTSPIDFNALLDLCSVGSPGPVGEEQYHQLGLGRVGYDGGPSMPLLSPVSSQLTCQDYVQTASDASPRSNGHWLQPLQTIPEANAPTTSYSTPVERKVTLAELAKPRDYINLPPHRSKGKSSVHHRLTPMRPYPAPVSSGSKMKSASLRPTRPRTRPEAVPAFRTAPVPATHFNKPHRFTQRFSHDDPVAVAAGYQTYQHNLHKLTQVCHQMTPQSASSAGTTFNADVPWSQLVAWFQSLTPRVAYQARTPIGKGSLNVWLGYTLPLIYAVNMYLEARIPFALIEDTGDGTLQLHLPFTRVGHKGHNNFSPDCATMIQIIDKLAIRIMITPYDYTSTIPL